MLLFPAIIEAFLYRIGEEWDPMRVDYAIQLHEQWYKGDGIYGGGPFFHWDYYNSFVIQPMMLDIFTRFQITRKKWKGFQPTALKRSQRFAAIVGRLIGPDGCFPLNGRSLCYRRGAFHLLAQIALWQKLPVDISPPQVRSALTVVI